MTIPTKRAVSFCFDQIVSGPCSSRRFRKRVFLSALLAVLSIFSSGCYFVTGSGDIDPKSPGQGVLTWSSGPAGSVYEVRRFDVTGGDWVECFPGASEDDCRTAANSLGSLPFGADYQVRDCEENGSCNDWSSTRFLADPNGSEKIEAGLLEKLQDGTVNSFLVMLGEADLSGADRLDWNARGEYVYRQLTDHAHSSQETLLADVNLQGGTATSFWIIDAVMVDGDAALAERVSGFSEVTSVSSVPEFELTGVSRAARSVVAGAGTSDPSWGMRQIHADLVWDAGVTGGGVTVGVLDTGIDATHPAISRQYRNDHGWWDGFGFCDQPCSGSDEHATAVTSLVLGGDGNGSDPNDIGAAPDAQWIAARVCAGLCPSDHVLGGLQFMLAPTDAFGRDPRPDLRPHVINGSFSSGRYGFIQGMFESALKALRAAGILPVFSAGNRGPDCGAVRLPGALGDALAVGATQQGGNIANFSSRGPSAGGTKPNLVAPGQDVAIAVPGGGYETGSGTSASAPTVAGVAALVISANTGYAGDLGGVASVMGSTAFPTSDSQCGEAGPPNNVYGYGEVRADAAVAKARGVDLDGVLRGAVTARPTREFPVAPTPIPGATVTATSDRGIRTSVVTQRDGDYELRIPAGNYRVGASADGYFDSSSVSTDINVGGTAIVNFELLSKTAVGTIEGTVTDEGGMITSATITATSVEGTTFETAMNPDATYRIEVLPGTYRVEASAPGRRSITQDLVIVEAGSATRLDLIFLVPSKPFGLRRKSPASKVLRWDQGSDDATDRFEIWGPELDSKREP